MKYIAVFDDSEIDVDHNEDGTYSVFWSSECWNDLIVKPAPEPMNNSFKNNLKFVADGWNNCLREMGVIE